MQALVSRIDIARSRSVFGYLDPLGDFEASGSSLHSLDSACSVRCGLKHTHENPSIETTHALWGLKYVKVIYFGLFGSPEHRGLLLLIIEILHDPMYTWVMQDV